MKIAQRFSAGSRWKEDGSPVGTTEPFLDASFNRPYGTSVVFSASQR
jgi:hypothetical protein